MNKYIIYARKSQEAEDKQVLSIESQIDSLKKIARQYNLSIFKILTEAKSSKTPGRPIFNEMIELIKNGKANSILVWHPDRLSRNSIDAGNIIYLIDLGLLQEVRTPTQVFRNTPTDKFVLNLLLSNAKLDNDNKSVNVKRGLQKRADLGFYPFSSVPQGYMNIKDLETGLPITVEDPERFPLVRKMWDLMLTGRYSVPEILNIVNNKWGYRTRKKRKSGGKPLSRTGLYDIFSNPFYYGWYKFNGEWKKSNHKPMITKEEFDKVQIILGRKDKPRPQKHFSPYSCLFKCGECGLSFVLTEKVKYYKRTNNLRIYRYYHCSKKGKNCSQLPLTEKELEDQILAILSKVEIHEDFKNWAIKYLKYINEKETSDRNTIIKNLQNNYLVLQNKLDRLLDAYLNGLISKEDYKRKQQEFLKEKDTVKKALEQSDYRADKWIDECERSFDFSVNLRKRFKNGSIEEKKQILTTIGANFIIKDKKVSIELAKPYYIFKKFNEGKEKHFISLEPPKKLDLPSNLAYPLKENPSWLPLKDLFCNREIEFGITLRDFKIAFESLGLNQLNPAFATCKTS